VISYIHPPCNLETKSQTIYTDLLFKSGSSAELLSRPISL
jgi:hypothetical protein